MFKQRMHKVVRNGNYIVIVVAGSDVTCSTITKEKFDPIDACQLSNLFWLAYFQD